MSVVQATRAREETDGKIGVGANVAVVVAKHDPAFSLKPALCPLKVVESSGKWRSKATTDLTKTGTAVLEKGTQLMRLSRFSLRLPRFLRRPAGHRAGCFMRVIKKGKTAIAADGREGSGTASRVLAVTKEKFVGLLGGLDAASAEGKE